MEQNPNPIHSTLNGKRKKIQGNSEIGKNENKEKQDSHEW